LSCMSRSCCPMWLVVAAYTGQRSFYIKFNWPFLGAERPVQNVFLLYELNATRHHRCGNETKSNGLDSKICLRPPEIFIWTEKKREVRGKFFRGDVVILGFRVRLMTLQKFSSDHAPSKSPFDQSPPLLLVSQRVSDHRRALHSLVGFHQWMKSMTSSEGKPVSRMNHLFEWQ
ncbi:hypothetical protein DAPPUDRAFT_122728, partial [Daphnia pulex]